MIARLRSEIRGDFDDGPALLFARISCTTEFVSLDVGASKPVDRLLWIPDKKQRAWPQPAVFPGSTRSSVRSNREEDFVLNPIGVLELVDQNKLVTSRRSRDGLLRGRGQGSDVQQQVVEVEDRRRPFPCLGSFRAADQAMTIKCRRVSLRYGQPVVPCVNDAHNAAMRLAGRSSRYAPKAPPHPIELSSSKPLLQTVGMDQHRRASKALAKSGAVSKMRSYAR